MLTSILKLNITEKILRVEYKQIMFYETFVLIISIFVGMYVSLGCDAGGISYLRS